MGYVRIVKQNKGEQNKMGKEELLQLALDFLGAVSVVGMIFCIPIIAMIL
jgi:hypothetical protein